jgi:hypothetical protein
MFFPPLASLITSGISDHPKPANEYHLKTGHQSGVWDIDTRGGV